MGAKKILKPKPKVVVKKKAKRVSRTKRTLEDKKNVTKKGGKTAGQPTKYSEKLITKVDDFLKEYEDERFQLVKSVGVSMSYENKIKVQLPTIYAFAKYSKVSLSSVEEWSVTYPKFSRALEKIKHEQKKRLIENGLAGSYNATIAKLLLSANHGMHETQKLENKVEEVNGFDFEAGFDMSKDIVPKDGEKWA